jgi:transposase InsO family protein
MPPKFNPPDKFNFIKPAEWPEWQQRFTRYRMATKLGEEDAEVQISCLIYAMGSEAENILKSFVFEQEDDKKDYAIVLKKYDDYFVPKKNVIHERARFHLRGQGHGESVEAFVRNLHEIADHCDFGDKSEQIRDRLVIGIVDKELSEKLQLQPDLTLDKAVGMARNSELVKSQMRDQQAKSIDAVSKYPKQARNYSHRGRGTGHRGGNHGSTHKPHQHSQKTETCGKCGYDHGDNTRCPATGKKCLKCGGMNHFAVRCRSNTKRKDVHEVTEGACADASCADSFFLGSVTTCEDEAGAWNTKLKICNRHIVFKIDTGADTSVITESTYNALPWKPKLQPASTVLQSPGGVLKCIGMFIAKTHHKGEEYQFRIHVVQGSHSNLLGRSVAHKMGLVVLNVEEVRSDIFGDHGCIKGPAVKITLKDDIKPHCVTTARRIPFPLMPKVEAELQRMESQGVIVKVTEPTDWCAPIVPVIKKNGNVRICVDLKKLNQAVKREHYMLPNLDDISPKLCGATLFSKLDASSGFHQLPLEEASWCLTTFITPFGRFCFKFVPFGITSAPEIFQRRMSELLSDVDGAETIMDDILIYGRTVEEHDERLERTLQKVQEAGLKLNRDKCEFRKEKIEYFGHVISSEGISPSVDRVKAIRELPAPTNVSELRRVVGMINYLGRFMPELSSVMHPMTDLLKSDTVWTWDSPQVEAFDKVKDMITDTPTLAFYDSQKSVVISADASSYGLGAALYQVTDGELKPVAFASRTLSPAEKKYAQIEKECLASVWACEKFDRYIVGVESFKLMTDHKPLVSLINTQDLDRTPLRCQRLLMRLMRFNAVAEYVPGTQLVVPDTLSRSPLTSTEDTSGDVNAFVDCVMATKPMSDCKLQSIQTATAEDPVLQEVINLTRSGWPDRERSVRADIRTYFASRSEYSVSHGLLLYRDRIVMPEGLRAETLDNIHSGHFGLNKCRARANTSVWWPGISRDIERIVQSCEFCREHRPNQKSEPLKPTALPDRPWQRIAADLCEVNGTQYLIVMDYYSRYLEIAHLETITSAQVIGKLKNMFAHWGVPEVLVSDNGGQFKSDLFDTFARKYGFTQSFSSPHFPQANGEAESGVKIAKRILQQDDIFDALMEYRVTPVNATGFSPSELMVSRKIRTILPVLPEVLMPRLPDLAKVRRNDEKAKSNMQRNYNNHHAAQTLPPVRVGDNVRIKTDKEKYWTQSGTVKAADYNARSYIVATPRGDFRRNRRHIQHTGYDEPTSTGISESLFVNLDTSSPSAPDSTTRKQQSSSPSAPDSTMRKPQSSSPSAPQSPRRPPKPPDADRVQPTTPKMTRAGRTVVKPKRYDDFVET